MLLGGLIARRIDRIAVDWNDLAFVLILALILWRLITGITHPRVLEFRRRAKTPSTSPAHYVTDVLFAAFGLTILMDGLDPGSPAFAFTTGWGCGHIAIALGLIFLRFSRRDD